MQPLHIILSGLLLAACFSHAQDNPGRAATESAVCLDCHDFGPQAPVHALLAGSHGLAGDAEAMAGRHGCPDCHGASTAHTDTPNEVAPDVSFGPRWTTTAAAQDAKCLACHEENTARDWQHALHMLNNLTCVTCHDLLTWEDTVLIEDKQASVCTTCHKAQKQGIHGMQEIAPRNPPCSGCHNPHDHESARGRMLENDSAACRVCHDPGAMSGPDSSLEQAGDHQVTRQADRTCVDCHQGIAHAATDSVTAMVPQALNSRQVTLFYPGTAHSDWLLRDHPGSQPLRQGRNCQQCHRGDEAGMGEVQANGPEPASRTVQIAFTLEGDELHIALQWQGPEDDSTISFMWGGRENEAFRRGGCFAACHSDMPGMSADGGRQTGKYLKVSRVEQQSVGQPPVFKDEQELMQLLADRQFAEMWRIQLHSSIVETSLVLAETKWRPTNLISINVNHSVGHWHVDLRRKLTNNKDEVSFSSHRRYTFGVALSGAEYESGRHWVSLPMTFSITGDETDFKVEQ